METRYTYDELLDLGFYADEIEFAQKLNRGLVLV